MCRIGLRIGCRSRQTEIDHFDVNGALFCEVEHQVSRLNVSMNNLFFLCAAQCSRHLTGNVESKQDVKPSMPSDEVIKAFAFDKLHRVVIVSTLRTKMEH